MREYGGHAAFRTQSHPAQKEGHDHAEAAHRDDAQKRPTWIAKPIVVAERGNGCMPEPPDDSTDDDGLVRRVFLHQVWKQVTAPAPFLTETGDEIRKRSDEHETHLRESYELDLFGAHRDLLPVGTRLFGVYVHHALKAWVEIAREDNEVNCGAEYDEDQGAEPRDHIVFPGAFELPGHDPRILESLAREQTREDYAQSRKDHTCSYA